MMLILIFRLFITKNKGITYFDKELNIEQKHNNIMSITKTMALDEEMNSGEMTLVCEIDHPLYDLIDNVTRRQVLRLIACESNYGNRIASIMDLSTPAIHRHLKSLLGDNQGKLALISKGKRSTKSHSGHKGGEAQLYRVDAKIGLFFHVFPNFVHNHILELHEENRLIIHDEKNKGEHLKYLEPFSSEEGITIEEHQNIVDKMQKLRQEEADLYSEIDSNTKIKKEIKEKRIWKFEEKKKKNIDAIGEDKLKMSFHELYKTIQKQNESIRKLEQQLMQELSVKNDFMAVVDTILQAQNDLQYEDRVIMRAITCLGKQCSSDLSHLLNMNIYQVEQQVDLLREKKWIKKEDK